MTVEPIASEFTLRNMDWVEATSRRFTQATNGRVAYVYVPNTAGQGHDYFKRYFFPQVDKDAIIIDERFNGGGQVADYYIDLLAPALHRALGDALRRVVPHARRGHLRPEGDAHRRDGRLGRRPVAVDVPRVQARAAGRQANVGRARRHPRLPDAHGRRQRHRARTSRSGPRRKAIGVENVGVPPDFDVEITPKDFIAGKDPQLDKAIELALAALKKNPPKKAEKPAFPHRVKP